MTFKLTTAPIETSHLRAIDRQQPSACSLKYCYSIDLENITVKRRRRVTTFDIDYRILSLMHFNNVRYAAIFAKDADEMIGPVKLWKIFIFHLSVVCEAGPNLVGPLAVAATQIRPFERFDLTDAFKLYDAQ